MGLRVATLVNLSFLGMDRLEQRLARFLAPAATARCIPEGVKRFTTWGAAADPLLHPPRRGTGITPGARPRPSSSREPARTARHARRAAVARSAARSWPARPSSRARRSSRRSARLQAPLRIAIASSTWSLSNTEYEVTLRRGRRGRQPDSATAATTSAGARTTSSTRPAGRSSWSTPPDPRTSAARLAGRRQLPGASSPTARASSGDGSA